MSGNDYLSLSCHPAVIAAASAAALTFGAGGGASRLVCGNHELHEALEVDVASFVGADASLVFSSGYLANLGVITALVGRDDLIICDKLIHASLIDAIRLSRAEFQRFRHNDANSLAELLRSHRLADASRRVFVVVESVYSMDGDVAPLSEVVELCEKYNACLIVDEAHAIGIFGDGGGVVCELGLEPRVPIRTANFSKACGSYGGFVACSREVREVLVNRARQFIYNTGLPLTVIAASQAALKILRENPEYGKHVLGAAANFRAKLSQHGFQTGQSGSQIIPLIIGASEDTQTVSRELFNQGILVVAIRPPTVPEGTSRLRFSINLEHTTDDLDRVVDALAHSAVLGITGAAGFSR